VAKGTPEMVAELGIGDGGFLAKVLKEKED